MGIGPGASPDNSAQPTKSLDELLRPPPPLYGEPLSSHSFQKPGVESNSTPLHKLAGDDEKFQAELVKIGLLPHEAKAVADNPPSIKTIEPKTAIKKKDLIKTPGSFSFFGLGNIMNKIMDYLKNLPGLLFRNPQRGGGPLKAAGGA